MKTYKFEFAGRKISLVFPNKSYTIYVDSVLRGNTVKIGKWLLEESELLEKKLDGASSEKAAEIWTDVTKRLFEHIDSILGKGAHAEILGERMNNEITVIYHETCDILGYLLGAVRETWDDMHSVKMK